MNKYELVYIVDAHLAPEAKEDINKQVIDAITKADGKIINSAVWFERQRISFPINKVQDGTYYLINWEGENAASTKIRQPLRLNERILRYLVINVNNQKAPSEQKEKVKV